MSPTPGSPHDFSDSPALFPRQRYIPADPQTRVGAPIIVGIAVGSFVLIISIYLFCFCIVWGAWARHRRGRGGTSTSTVIGYPRVTGLTAFNSGNTGAGRPHPGVGMGQYQSPYQNQQYRQQQYGQQQYQGYPPNMSQPGQPYPPPPQTVYPHNPVDSNPWGPPSYTAAVDPHQPHYQQPHSHSHQDAGHGHSSKGVESHDHGGGGGGGGASGPSNNS